ncbi:hypothetical protein COO60DRAFT_140667 [Scenedesmus sp. NREL 46B-D3]|nr:hypothetical protein COO60DRAFT_140667 [Scenedesmus sp. NREL 46B-D3]
MRRRCCQPQQDCACVRRKQDAPKLQSIAAGVAAAMLLSVAPANAGVILEQPQIKKVLQDDTPVVPAPKREIILPGQRKNAPAAASAAAPKVKAAPKAAETSGGDLDPRSVALPGAAQAQGLQRL